MVENTEKFGGFTPDRGSQLIITGIGVMFFITSGFLAFLIMPSLFENNVFQTANQNENVNPSQENIKNIAIVIFNHLLWMLGPFVVAGYVLQFRRMGLYLASILILISIWRFEFIPLITAGKYLITGIWVISTTILAFYWENLD